MQSRVKLHGRWFVEVYDGEIMIAEYDIWNTIVTVGLNHWLDVAFHGETQVDPWYIGLIEDSGWSGVVAGDTMASHAGWTECTAYSEANRVEYNEAAAAAGVTTNSANKAEFSMNATKTLKGAFLVSDNTKGGSSGTLFAAGAFSGGDQPVVSGNTVQVTYQLTAS